MAAPAPYPGAPRWVKVFGIILAVVVLLFVILLFTRGPHGPRRHMPFQGPPGEAAGRTPISLVTEDTDRR
jgi:hypothetical protein